MQPEIFSRRTLLMVVLGVSFSLGFAVAPSEHQDPWVQRGTVLFIKEASTFPIQEQTSTGLPVRLRIPRIDVDSPVEYIGLSSDGAMDVPKSRDNVGWFQLGQRPGQSGSAVIAGHYGWQNQKGSVFDNLHKLHEGDVVYIEDDRGGVISFVVKGVRRYDPKADTTDVFGSSDEKSHLNLVTCEGEWDEATQQYSRRLVVFTDRVVDML